MSLVGKVTIENLKLLYDLHNVESLTGSLES